VLKYVGAIPTTILALEAPVCAERVGGTLQVEHKHRYVEWKGGGA